MAVIEFDGYSINKMTYEKNLNFVGNSESVLENSINFQVDMNDAKDKAIITLGLTVGSKESNAHPFYTDVELEGYFKYDEEEDELDRGFHKFLMTSGAAILYPYLRSTVSSLTNLTEFPAYILPTINIASVIDQKYKDE